VAIPVIISWVASSLCVSGFVGEQSHFNPDCDAILIIITICYDFLSAAKRNETESGVKKGGAVREVTGIILAGGAGESLKPLTALLAKPAVPFGKYRIIDFVLNNFINFGIKNIKILVQTLSQPLINHII
jgi:hypothetical protein